MEREETDLYKRFYNQLWEKYGLKKVDILTWKYAGYFHADTYKMTDFANDSLSHEMKLDIDRGHRLWVDEMGDVPMPYELAEDECVCKVKIIWNHILVNPKAEETEMIILGSECIEKFLGISMKRKCQICDKEMRNIKSGICKPCNEKQKIRCKKSGCRNDRVKYKKFCNYCLNSQVYCPCGENKKTKYKGKYMPQCYECWSMTKSK
jgi:hypothetical protein